MRWGERVRRAPVRRIAIRRVSAFLAILFVVPSVSIGCGNGTARKGESSGVKGLAQQSGQSVAKVKHALDGLKQLCTESEADLANEISKALSDINSHGTKVSATGLIAGLEGGIGTAQAQDNSGPQNCKRVIAALSGLSG
jgi:hypothetical protein